MGYGNRPYEVSDNGDISYLTVTAGNQITLQPGFKASPSGSNQFIAEIQQVALNYNDSLKLTNLRLNKKSINGPNVNSKKNAEEKLLSKNIEVKVEIPESYGLSQNYPNPFNPTTAIQYQLPVDSRVTLKVYDILGRQVASLVSEFQQAGYKEVRFNASSLASGTYIYRIVAGNFISAQKMVVLK